MASWSRIARRVRVPLGFGLAVLYLWLALPTWVSIAVGAVIAMLGLLLRAIASGHITKDSALTTTGPYAYTRNPLYMGSMLLATGFAVGSRSWWIALVMLLMFLLIYLPVIREEETYLRAQFPEFDQYARHVPRFLPRLRRWPGAAPAAFSRERYLRHHEYNALVGAAVMLAALVAKLLWLAHR